MKPGSPTTGLAPLADKLQHARQGSAAPAWLGGAPPAPEPLFPSAPPPAPVPAPVVVDPAEVERKVAAAMAEARAEGEKQGLAAGEAEIGAALARLGEALGTVDATARTMVRPYAGELVELALIIARELVGAEIRRDPAPLVQLVERCLDDMAGESSITLRLHPADRAALLAARPELARPDLRIIDDAALARGGCAVESARRLIDARLEERLDNVRDGLRELLEEADRAADA